MCGRYYRRSGKQNIAEAFREKLVDDGTPSPPWDYNVAPTTIQPIIRNNRDTNERELVSLRWGLIPFFTKDIKDVKGISTINARSEAVTTSRTFREPFKKRRCLVPASGFYEWKKLDEKNKQPFAFDLANGQMMAFAGLWDGWKDPATGNWLQSYAIITTEANELMGRSTTGCRSSFTRETSTAGSTASSMRLACRSICCARSLLTRWRPSR